MKWYKLFELLRKKQFQWSEHIDFLSFQTAVLHMIGETKDFEWFKMKTVLIEIKQRSPMAENIKPYLT